MEYKTRSARLNKLAEINKAQSYLEIGVAQGDTFSQVTVPRKVAVDPRFQFDKEQWREERLDFLEVSSDEFFRKHAAGYPPFDLIYLDGLHTFEQTFRDFCATISCSGPSTIWLIDDTFPDTYAQSLPIPRDVAAVKKYTGEVSAAWMGDVYKVVGAIHDFFPQFSFLNFIDHGQTVVWQQWRADFKPIWDSLESISRMDYAQFVRRNVDIFRQSDYDQVFAAIESATMARQRP